MKTELEFIPSQQERASLKMKPDSIKVSGDGVFHTIQGEGASIGQSAVFLRLHFCNLACSWCDTKYTWDSTKKEFWQESKDWTYDEAAAQVMQFPAKRLVVTGGEPLLQQKGIEEVVKRLDGWATEIETNGTIPPSNYLASKVQFNVSPKLAHSNNVDPRRYKPDVLRAFNQLDRTTFKIVAKQADDFKEIDQMVKDCDLNPDKMIIMPEGTSNEALRDNGLAIVDSVKERGWRLLPRFHVLLWGNQRGI